MWSLHNTSETPAWKRVWIRCGVYITPVKHPRGREFGSGVESTQHQWNTRVEESLDQVWSLHNTSETPAWKRVWIRCGVYITPVKHPRGREFGSGVESTQHQWNTRVEESLDQVWSLHNTSETPAWKRVWIRCGVYITPVKHPCGREFGSGVESTQHQWNTRVEESLDQVWSLHNTSETPAWKRVWIRCGVYTTPVKHPCGREFGSGVEST